MREDLLVNKFDFGYLPEFGELHSIENKKASGVKLEQCPVEQGIKALKRQDMPSRDQGVL